MNWSMKVSEILESETGSLRELAEIAGFNPKHFYRGVSLSGADLRGQDLSDLDLSGCDMTGVLTDRATKFSIESDPNAAGDYTRRSIKLSRNLYMLVRVFESELSYVYTGWAIKRAIERSFHGLKEIRYSQVWLDWLAKSESARQVVDHGYPGGVYTYSLKIKTEHYHSLLKAYRSLGSSNKALRMAILVGIFDFWNAGPEAIAETNILDFMKNLKKRPAAEATLLSLEKTWS